LHVAKILYRENGKPDSSLPWPCPLYPLGLALPTVPTGPRAGNMAQKTSAIFEKPGFHIFKVGPEWRKRRIVFQKILTPKSCRGKYFGHVVYLEKFRCGLGLHPYLLLSRPSGLYRLAATLRAHRVSGRSGLPTGYQGRALASLYI
jgi:hypothetical protein